MSSNKGDYAMSMAQEMGKHAGKWISIVDDEIVAKGNNAKKVFMAAKKEYPKKTPLVIKVPTDGVMLL